jgi:hypothetical protein
MARPVAVLLSDIKGEILAASEQISRPLRDASVNRDSLLGQPLVLARFAFTLIPGLSPCAEGGEKDGRCPRFGE